LLLKISPHMEYFRKLSLFIVLTFIGWGLQAQVKYTISGHIKDGKSGEELIGATVLIKGTQQGTTTNSYGFYSLTLEAGKYTLSYSYMGFVTQEKEIDLQSNLLINIELQEATTELKEAEVTAKGKEESAQQKKISVVSMDIQTIKKLPAMFGEVDVLKTIQLMPGIQSAGEGNAGFNVRGGATDQNLILLDEATVYNAAHLMGFFSVFNSDAIKDLDLYKGGMPARYGGRLSSIVDIRMRDGNSKRYSATGGIGTVSSRLTLEGPIVKERGSFLASGRRTYADLFLKLSPKPEVRSNRLYFYDFNAKANYRIDDKNRIYLSGYFGRDVFGFANLFGFDWGNATGTFRWNHLFNQKLFSNITAIYSNFDYGIQIDFSETANYRIASGIRDVGLKADFSYFASPNSKLYFGGISTNHLFQPGKITKLRPASIFNESALPNKNALESSLYIDHEYKWKARWSFRYGLRYTSFINYGASTEYVYNPDGNGTNKPSIKDTLSFGSYEKIAAHNGWEPRAALSFSVNELTSLKASYDRTYQFLHQASNSGTTLPTDLWIPSGLNIQPQYADQYAVGLFRDIASAYQASVEVYYKSMKNSVDFRDNAVLFFNQTLERELLVGKTWSYGSEFFLQKKKGNFTGWISYTLAKTQRQVDGINKDKPYPVKNDRRHNISIVLNQKITERVALAAAWVYATGNAVTFPSGKLEFDGQIIPYYAERNGYRMPAYHRLDLSITIDAKKKENKRFESSFVISAYNAYNRANAFAIIFEEKKDENGNLIGETQAVKITLFKIIPSVTWNFKF
jgi:hypothetical protein